ncbi:MAG: aminotransferase [Pseudomonadota bacterium]
MKIEPFGVEMWMNAWETRCRWNLAETCVQSLTLDQLLQLAGKNDADLAELLPLKMTYGAIEGSDALRDAIAGLYAAQTRENILAAHGTIGANMLVHKTLVGPGDHVIAVTPTYQQHVSIPESLGARVDRLPLRARDGWRPDLDALDALATSQTRLIALTNPNNPTGALIDADGLVRLAEIARRAGAWVLCDEVYRGSDQHGDGMTASLADLYERGISTASMSKVFSLAGLRLGWIAGPQDLLRRISHHRDYDTISVGRIDDHFAALALSAKDRILERTRRITRGNLALLADWVAAEPGVDWVKPRSGTTALLDYDLPEPSHALCVALLEETGVLLTPGSALGMEGSLRIGYANDPQVLREGLPRLSDFLRRRRAAGI